MPSQPLVFASLVLSASAVVNPTIKLNNGIEMPMVGAGTWQYNSSEAYQSVVDAIDIGYTHIDTANNYGNQDGVGKALKNYDRSSFFLTTKIPGCGTSNLSLENCYEDSKKALQQDLDLLEMPFVDLMLVHFPPLKGGCAGHNCAIIQGQWRAVEELYAAGKAKAIGVSNFCVSCFECLKQNLTVMPAVNQIQYHVGMGADPDGLFSYLKKLGVVPQAYSPLGNGSPELIDGKLTTAIGSKYNKSSVQVALKYVVQHGVPVLTKSTKKKYLAQDIDLFDFTLSPEDMQKLDAATTPAGNPSFACTA